MRVRPNWFLGWPVDPGAWFAPLVADAPRALRRFHPDDLHVTLAFLGPVEEEAARAAWALAETLPLTALDGELDRVEGFGNPRAPSALSVEIRGEAIRDAIAAFQGPLLAVAGAPPERRPPRAHCTVARPRREAGHAERAAGLAWARRLPPLGLPVRLDRLALYTWSLDRRERQFRVVASRALGAALRA